MSRLGVFLVFLISSEYIHLVSSRVRPVKLSQQKGGDVRGQRPRKTQLIKSHGMYKTFNLRTDFRPWEQREGPFYIVPYTITGQSAKEEMNYIETAMAHIQNNTCIQFREWRGEKNFLKIEDEPLRCFTEVNKTTPMILNLEKTHRTEEGEETCMTVKIVLHELLHAVGLEHEHQRPDRDEHVKLVEKNIDPNETDQYKKLKPQKIATFGLPYDYNSIMHTRKRLSE
ncbi:unnamed protein product [Cylicocyclus nassatus]|uniref:Metalloendopeptidase n=1 Tax=Cylicocyclus nassatus TaxID=53992 RepID=A0AA36GPH5_CYLNA|nr:unnamed protein product [Cylicocyclus nassatus]